LRAGGDIDWKPQAMFFEAGMARNVVLQIKMQAEFFGSRIQDVHCHGHGLWANAVTGQYNDFHVENLIK
jgi:hypothetical protein